jgi:hypothetical protein
MQRSLPCPHHCSLRRIGLVGLWQQATLLHEVREQQEQGLIGTEQCANQDEAQ